MLAFETLEESFARGVLPQRVSAAVSGSLGAIGILLAGLGLYGLMAYVVTQRTREIGIRLAVGATRADVIRLIVRQGMAFVVAGAAIGLTIAIVAGALLTRVFVGFPRLDAAALAAGAAVALAAGLAACVGPVRRATRIGLMETLRYE